VEGVIALEGAAFSWEARRFEGGRDDTVRAKGLGSGGVCTAIEAGDADGVGTDGGSSPCGVLVVNICRRGRGVGLGVGEVGPDGRRDGPRMGRGRERSFSRGSGGLRARGRWARRRIGLPQGPRGRQFPRPMKAMDRWLQRWRIRQACRWVPSGARVVDVGAHRGELLAALGERLNEGWGVEGTLETPVAGPRYRIEPGLFPEVAPEAAGWDVVTMLAVLEHVPPARQPALAAACARVLRPGGRVIVTVPSPRVDGILAVLRGLRLVHGMSLEEHFGFEPAAVPGVFAPPDFVLLRHERFQLGLNHLFVFVRSGGD
jgi:SAM-dependent methyltransferase